jgi:hypothetical protein
VLSSGAIAYLSASLGSSTSTIYSTLDGTLSETYSLNLQMNIVFFLREESCKTRDIICYNRVGGAFANE